MEKIERKFTITSIIFEDGKTTMERTNDGFQAFELLGILDISASDIRDQINKKKAPDVFIRNLLIDVENPRNELEQLFTNYYRLGCQASEEGKSMFDCPFDANSEDVDTRKKAQFWEQGFIATVGAKLKYPASMQNENFADGEELAADKKGKIKEYHGTAYFRGRNDFISGKKITDNPYAISQHDGQQWIYGYETQALVKPKDGKNAETQISLEKPNNEYILEGKRAFEKGYSRGANPYIFCIDASYRLYIRDWYAGYDKAQTEAEPINATDKQQKPLEVSEGFKANLSLFIEKLNPYDKSSDLRRWEDWNIGWNDANEIINAQKLTNLEFDEIAKSGISGFLESKTNPYDMSSDILRYAFWEKAYFRASKIMISNWDKAYSRGQDDGINKVGVNPYKEPEHIKAWKEGYDSTYELDKLSDPIKA